MLEKDIYVIYSVDLGEVKKSLIFDGWKKDDAAKAIDLYRNYLFLRRKYLDMIFPPSKEIDAVWRSHILLTSSYREFCKKAFSVFKDRYLERDFQNLDLPNIRTLLKNVTQVLYYKEFGSYLTISSKPRWF